MNDSKSIYISRINRVTEYLRANLDQSPSLEELAKVAYFSPFHFHRIFTAVTGETVNACSNRLRLEKAARLLKYTENSATTIALECGFSSSSTFSRSFKQYFGTTPNEYRKTGTIENSKICKDFFPMDEYLLPMSDEELEERFPVEIRAFPKRRIAFERVIGAYQENVVNDAFARLIKWAKDTDLFEAATVFGMSLDDPSVTPQEKYRYEACLTIPDDFKFDSDSGFSETVLPESSYAVTRASGDIKIVATATHYLFEKWLIKSRFEPEHNPGLEIFIDKENVCDWEQFELELCIPVKPIQTF